VVNTSSLSLQDRLGTLFFAVNNKYFKAPIVNEISFQIPDAAAFWGATGRDSEGNIYFGVSTYANEDQQFSL
jgi:hypothetical protein